MIGMGSRPSRRLIGRKRSLKKQTPFLRRLFKREAVMVELTDRDIQLSCSQSFNRAGRERILFHEMSLSEIKNQVSLFLNGRKPREIILILKRSDVLQRNLELPGMDQVSLSRAVRVSLRCDPKTMTYGLLFYENQRRGSYKAVMVAVPEERIREKLVFLRKVGLKPTEIVVEDQLLAAVVDVNRFPAYTLILSRDKEKILTVLSFKGRLVSSRVFNQTDLTAANISDLCQEILMFMMEMNVKPAGVFLSGCWNDFSLKTLKSKLREHDLSVYDLKSEDWNQSECLSRMGRFDGVISLLPKEEKVRRWKVGKVRDMREALYAGIVLAGLVWLAFQVYGGGQSEALARVNASLESLQIGTQQIEEIQGRLGLLNLAQKTKVQILDLMLELSRHLPENIELKQIKREKNKFFFKGESPGHSDMTEAVRVFERINFLEEVKLGHTRLRKSLNREFFEFEVTGVWKN